MNTLITPNKNELPSVYAERVGKDYIGNQTLNHKKEYAQFFTPKEVAKFMARLATIQNSSVALADLGAGTGILGISVCKNIIEKNPKIKNIKLTAYELDNEIIPYLEASLSYAKKWLNEKKVKLSYEILNSDFILDNASVLQTKPTSFKEKQHSKETYDVIISNPPYFKLNKSDPRATAMLSVIHGQPNIYALFMVLSAHLLNDNGELIFITPRSYTAGPYFRLFREHFFSIVKPTFIHLFGSRNKAFDKDDVLQENIILKAEKRQFHESHPDADHNVLISYSNDLSDLELAQTRTVPSYEVIDLNTKNKVVRIPLNTHEDKVIKLIHAWNGSLHKYGMQISTGPVVPFRSRNLIRENGFDEKIHFPLLWMQNIKPMITQWPIKTRKQQYIQYNNESKKLFVKNSNYVLLRRFSAKEENQRLVSAPYLSSLINTNMIGLENHLNYIYRPESDLTNEEVFGLAALYNSKLFDTYFRTFSGNTQVSATEIKDMPLPELSVIKKIGSILISNKVRYNQLDDMVKDIVHPTYSFAL